MMCRNSNETEIDRHRNWCVVTAVIIAADVSPSCTGRLYCASLLVAFTWTNITFSETDGSSMDTHCLQVKFTCIFKISQRYLWFFINLNFMEREVLMKYRGSSWAVIIFKFVHPRYFPESQLNQQMIRQIMCILRCVSTTNIRLHQTVHKGIHKGST